MHERSKIFVLFFVVFFRSNFQYSICRFKSCNPVELYMYKFSFFFWKISESDSSLSLHSDVSCKRVRGGKYTNMSVSSGNTLRDSQAKSHQILRHLLMINKK